MLRSIGSATAGTTKRAGSATGAAGDHIRIVGYVRVSTDIQANEGVSLEAQSEKLKAYCKLHDVELIGIYKDEGLSAKSLERPGLQSALKALERGKANTLLVVKLDRLTRSLLDLDALIRGYFSKEQYHLLSVSESLDTRTAMGRFVLYILGLIAQWEREAIGERTREAMAHLKRQGVPLGAAPYGFLYSNERDDAGRKRLVAVPEEMAVIARIVEMFDAGASARAIATQLSTEGVTAARGSLWHGNVVRRILVRQQRPNQRPRKPNRPPRVWDHERATELALASRREGLSLRAIGKRLDEARLCPQRGGAWHAATILALLGPMSAINAVDARTRAQQLRAEGLSLREIGRRLIADGYRPQRAGHWHTQAVSALLAITPQ